jgi:hypothetical protein
MTPATIASLESRAEEIGKASAEYYAAWPASHDLTQLINREWQENDLDALCDGLGEDDRENVCNKSGSYFAIAVCSAHSVIEDQVDDVAESIIESARIYKHGPADRDSDGDLYDTVMIEIDYIGCYGDLSIVTRDRIESAIAERFGLVDWRMDGIVTETGECWTYYRPAGE